MAHCIGIDARKAHDFGIGTYVRNLVDFIGRLDGENNYILFTGRDASGSFAELPENFRLVEESAPVYSGRELFALAWRLWRRRVDLYHATHYVLPAFVPGKAVVTIHDIIHLLYPQFLPSALAYLYAQRMIRRSLTRGDAIIAVSSSTKTDLMEYFDVGGDKIQVVYQGVSDVFRQSLGEERIAEVAARLELKRPYLLFVGNPKPHKNLDNVVRAYARALKLRPFDGDLVCIGNRGQGDFKLEQRAEQLGIRDRVRLVGHVADELLPAIYQGATLFLFPTLYEGFGLPVVEAMASGVPVITSNTSALHEIAEGYAHLVDPLDVDAIAGAIAKCMHDPEHRESLAQLGRRRAEDFRWKRTAEQTLEIYRRTLRRSRGGERRQGGDA
ncbi:MAG: glycosyltransferase family 4 protein [Thermoanaerobaculia bacterium]